jgi:hypothetical protein
VSNAYGQNMGTTYDYAEAYQIAESAEDRGACDEINTITNSYAQPNYCQIEPSAENNQYYDVVNSEGQVLSASLDYQDALNLQQNDAACYQ